MAHLRQFPETFFAPQAVGIAPLADGGMRMFSSQPLRPYPTQLSERLCHWALRSPDRTYLAERAAGADHSGWRRITYAEALSAIRSLAQALLDRGLSVHRPVAILSGNSIDHALLALAAMHAGIPVVPISPFYSLQSRTFAKLRHVLDLVRPGLVFASDGGRFAPALAAASVSCEIVVSAGKPDGLAATPLAALRDTKPRQAVEEANARVGPDTVAKILFSSGSTDLPKGVITTQRMMCSNQAAVAQVWPFLASKPPVLVDWLPWNHVFGGSFCFNLTLFHGGTLYIDDGAPSARMIGHTVANLGEISPTLYLNVPLGYDLLLPHLERNPVLRQRFFARLDGVFYAAAALPMPLWHRLDQLGAQVRGAPVPMISAWGATETAPVATAIHFAIERTSMIGLPVPGSEVKLVPQNGRLELRVRGPNVTPGYWRRDDLTRAAFDEDGFLRLGDAGRLADAANPRQGLEFSGRIAEDFKLSSGTWVNPGAVRIKAIAAGTPVIQDAVITGHDRPAIGLLIVPSEQGCRALCPELPEDTSLETLLARPKVRRCIAQALAAMMDEAEGSSLHPIGALLMAEPLSPDNNEITDKGYINQRAVLARRFELVERLYAVPRDPAVITAPPLNRCPGQARTINVEAA